MEIKVEKIKYNPLDLSEEEKFEYLKEEGSTDEEIEDLLYNPEYSRVCEETIPRHQMALILKNRTPYLEEKNIEDVIERVILDALDIPGKVIDVIAKRLSIIRFEAQAVLASSHKEEIYIEICKKFTECLLLVKLRPHIKLNGLICSNFPRQVRADFLENEDWTFISRISPQNGVYICITPVIGERLEAILLDEETGTLPKINLSQYVEEMEKIIRTDLFSKFCEGGYILELKDQLDQFRIENFDLQYAWAIIEHILEKIAFKMNYLGRGSLYCYIYQLSNLKRPKSDPSKNLRISDATAALIYAIDRNSHAHGSLMRPNHDKKYFAILCLKALRDIYLDFCFYESYEKSLKKLADDTSQSSGYYLHPDRQLRSKISNISDLDPSRINFSLTYKEQGAERNVLYEINLLNNTISAI
jgi:hypothetical protein